MLSCCWAPSLHYFLVLQGTWNMVTGTSLHVVDLHNTSSHAVRSLNPALMH